MDNELEYYEYDDDDEEAYDPNLAEQYQQYMAAAMGGSSGRRYLAPHERIPFDEQLARCQDQLFFVRHENGMTTLEQLGLLFGLCLLVLFTSCLTFLPAYVVPLSSTLAGSYVLFAYFNYSINCVYSLIAYVAINFAFMHLMHRITPSIKGLLGWRVGMFSCAMLLMLQYNLPKNEFLRIRGCLMIMAMKTFSLGFDIDTDSGRRMPNTLDFVSYFLGINTVMFGPWINYRQYQLLMRQKDFKHISRTLIRGFGCMLVSIACLVHSSCLLEWFIPDDYEYYTFWLISLRDAMMFRFSHYFVSFAAEASLYLSGYLAVPSWTDEIDSENEDGDSRRGPNVTETEEYRVTRPIRVELPRSLVDVVVNWNIPMHKWLKKYVFVPMKEDCGYFWGVMLTYVVSALLHGFNFQISAVLLSLGMLTYSEHVLREKLARGFKACIRARPCKENCGHVHKKWQLYVMAVNGAFFVLAVLHLSYLGMVFDSSEVQEEGYNPNHTLAKWSRLNFISHQAALGTFIFAKII